MAFHSLVNTRYFSEAAIDWKTNNGRYTMAPKGSRDYFQYWEEQDRRCMYGYKVGDLWIPGRHYFFLNFSPMSRVPEHVMIRALEERRSSRGKLSMATAEKIISFPSFWEVHFEWHRFKHVAWYGGEFMGVHSPGGRHMTALKTRGAGWSYLEASDGVYNYNFIPGSKSYYFASAEPFLVGDAIMDKVQSGLDWINEYSPYWKKNRQKKFSLMHQKASYIDAFGTERGTMSEIMGQIVDKPGKTRGKRGRKATFEEGGTFPNLEPALEVSLGSMREGSVYVGQVSVFGTGGEEGASIQGLENIFYNPEAWDMMAFPNIFDENMAGTTCGYFVPCYRANSWFMDEDGNVDIEGAIVADEIEREKKRKSGRPKDLDRRKAEYPRTPSEALQRLNDNGFNIAEIDNQIKKIQTSKAIQAMIRHGKLIRSEAGLHGVEFIPQAKSVARPIEDFPHKKGDNLTGCVSILQRPYLDRNGNIPDEMYFISVDSYSKEKSEDETSLFSVKVWKQENRVDSVYAGLPIAWYAGRPKRLDDNHDILFMLSDMYNAKIQGEIAGGGQMIVNYARTHKMLHKIKMEPDMIHNKDYASKSAGNSHLMNMTEDRKRTGLLYLEDWHIQPRGIDEKGNMVLNIHCVYDIAWLREMRKHRTGLNADRISDAIIAMYELKEREALLMSGKVKSRSFYSDRHILFGNNEASISSAVTTPY